MPSLRNVLDTIAREATVGTPVAREYAIPITAISGLDTEISKEVDPAIAGRTMDAGSYLTSKNSNDGGTPISPRACKAMALLLHSCLGGGTISSNDLQGVQIGAIIRVKYTGSLASCKFTIDQTADEFSALTGAKGSETDDANFNSGSAYDISAGTANTVADMVSDIEGYTDFNAEFVMGDRTIDAHELILFDATDDEGRQGKDTWCFLYFASASSGVYTYEIPVVLTSTERPSLTRQVDGRGGNEVWGGQVIDVMSISAALQALAEGNIQGPAMAQYRPKSGITGTTASGDATVTNIDTREMCPGMEITGTGIPASTTISSITTIAEDGELELSQTATASATVSDIAVDVTASSVTLDAADPFVFCQGKTSVDGSLKSYIRNMSIEMNNNHAADIGYGQGRCDRQLQQKGKIDVMGTIQLAMDTDAYALRNASQDGTMIAIHFEFRGGTLGNGLYEYMIIELPYCEIEAYSRPENSEQVDASFDYKAVNPPGTLYNSPCKITLVAAHATI